MTRFNQKVRERFFVEECGQRLGEEWVIGADRERPDFVVKSGTEAFGLEVCEIFNGPKTKVGSEIKRGEAERQRMLDRMRQDYERQHPGVHLSLKVVGRMTSKNASAIVPNLIAVGLHNKPLLHHEVIDEGDGLRVHVTRGFRSNWIFSGDHVGWVNFNPLPKIVEAVASKAAMLDIYKHECEIEDIRLLVYSDRHLNSGKMDFREPVTLDRMGFTRVYFLSFPERAISF